MRIVAMKNKRILLLGFLFLLTVTTIIISCAKDKLKINTPQPPPVDSTNSSFVEEFNNVSDLRAKGWIFKNNSDPVGTNGWRQGVYEAAPSSKFPVAVIGFPAYSASTSPNDFISCDASSVNLEGNISAWLISPALNIKNGDKIIFWARALDDRLYPIYAMDRMQVLMDITGTDPDVGNSAVSVGNFSKLLLDINPSYIENDLGGFPIDWTYYSITVSGLAAPVKNARIAFRYLGTDAGVNGPNYASVVGIDSLAFESK
jgi:hypothetical protein